ncbi:MAG: hypothetical protein FD138_3578 [Planctomycetota bacterium]|nr:MAG: hypothetical protein FD138_3578 [Planctomycetota bacterium]
MTIQRRTFLGFAIATLAGSASLSLSAETAEEGFQPLFDGKTFEGWEGDLKTFRIEEGAIIGGTMKEKIPRNEFLTTKKEYGDFELRLQAKLAGDGANAGVQFRTKRIPEKVLAARRQSESREGVQAGRMERFRRPLRRLARADLAQWRADH